MKNKRLKQTKLKNERNNHVEEIEKDFIKKENNQVKAETWKHKINEIRKNKNQIKKKEETKKTIKLKSNNIKIKREKK